jgi:hypothetical protein
MNPVDELLRNPEEIPNSGIAQQPSKRRDSGCSQEKRPERTSPEPLEARVENLPMIAEIPAESFSRACTNLALLAIGFTMAWKPAHG